MPSNSGGRHAFILFVINIASIGVGGVRVMQKMDSVMSIVDLNTGIVLIVTLLAALGAIRIYRVFHKKIQESQKAKQDVNQIQELRTLCKQDISTFVRSYRKDIYTKLEDEKTANGLYVFWSGADEVFRKFKNDASQINKLPSKEERVAIRSFYTESKALIDGILYNNHLLKRYQYLHCKIKTTTATSAELNEADTVIEQLSSLGSQLQQQHYELQESLEMAKAHF